MTLQYLTGLWTVFGPGFRAFFPTEVKHIISCEIRLNTMQRQDNTTLENSEKLKNPLDGHI